MDEAYTGALVRCYVNMGYFGVMVQPFDVFRDAYYVAGGYPHNWVVKRIVVKSGEPRIDPVLMRMHGAGWRAIINRTGVIGFSYYPDPDYVYEPVNPDDEDSEYD